jgi:hypothetical protein
VEFKNILLSMSETKNAPSPRRKAHRRSQNSASASMSSNDEKMLDSDTAITDKNKVTPSNRVKKTESWDSMCDEYENEESRQVRRIHKNQSIYRGLSQYVRRQDLQPPSTPRRKSTGA